MSRIGTVPVAIPSGVTAAIENGVLSVKGPKGNLTLGMREEISYAVDGDTIVIKPANATKAARAFWGMQRTLGSSLQPEYTRRPGLETRATCLIAGSPSKYFSSMRSAGCLPVVSSE